LVWVVVDLMLLLRIFVDYVRGPYDGGILLSGSLVVLFAKSECGGGPIYGTGLNVKQQRFEACWAAVTEGQVAATRVS
jgi:hypothetical protein